MAKVLIIEDDLMFQQALRRGLQLHGHEVDLAGSGLEGLEQLVQEVPDIVLLDLLLDEGDLNGLDVLGRIRDLYPVLPVIFMTGYGTVETAVEAMKQGASDYVQKPLNIEEILFLIERSIEVARLRQEVGYLRRYQAETLRPAPLVAVSQAMQRVVELARRAARGDATVLLCGESGTGKDVIARFIHSESARRNRPYVVVHCGALPAASVESELFGRQQEANASSAHQEGKFELADGGTLLLDEIGEMSPENQAKLLRVLEDRTLDREGGNRAVPVDVRLIAISNRDLEEAVREGYFREDLFYRINQVALQLPPLRERREDLAPLVEVFLQEFSKGSRRKVRLSEAAHQLLLAHRWPGNVRELRNLVERIALLEDTDEIRPEHLTFRFANAGGGAALLSGIGDLAALVAQVPPGQVFDHLVRLLLEEALRRSRGNQAEASRWLGLSRSRFTYRLQRYRIDSRDFH